MPLRLTKLRSTNPARTGHRVLLLLTPALMLLLNACAAQKPFQFHANSITKISYDPKNCAELPDGKYRCKDVIFQVSNHEPLQQAKK